MLLPFVDCVIITLIMRYLNIDGKQICWLGSALFVLCATVGPGWQRQPSLGDTCGRDRNGEPLGKYQWWEGVWGWGSGASAAVREMHLKFSLHTCRLELQRICRVVLCALFVNLGAAFACKSTVEVAYVCLTHICRSIVQNLPELSDF